MTVLFSPATPNDIGVVILTLNHSGHPRQVCMSIHKILDNLAFLGTGIARKLGGE